MASVRRTLLNALGGTSTQVQGQVGTPETQTSTSTIPPLKINRKRVMDTGVHSVSQLGPEVEVPAIDLGSQVAEEIKGNSDIVAKKMKGPTINLDDSKVDPPHYFRCSVWDKDFLDRHEDYQMLDSLVLMPKDQEVL